MVTKENTINQNTARLMKKQLEQLYGEYMQLREQSSDYLLQKKYIEKMQAIEMVLKPMPYGAVNPINEIYPKEEPTPKNLLNQFLNNDEAKDARIGSRTVYLSKEDVLTLLERQAKAIHKKEEEGNSDAVMCTQDYLDGLKNHANSLKTE